MEQSTHIDAPDEPSALDGIREKRRPKAGTLIPALALIAVGAWAFITYQNQPDTTIAAMEVIGLLTAGLGVSLLARFFVSKRVEAGLLFVGSFITLVAAASVGAWLALSPEDASLAKLWPVGFIALGLALFLTMLLAQMRGLLLAGLCSIVAGVVALPFTLEAVPDAIIDAITTYWPLALAVAGVIAITIAFHDHEAAALDDLEEEETEVEPEATQAEHDEA